MVISLPSLAPSGLHNPVVEGYNGSAIQISWQPPRRFNGPAPTYIVRSSQASLAKPPLAVDSGIRFTGVGHYLFPPDTVPQGVSFTGKQPSAIH